LGTDVIAGFPGETAGEFGHTLDMLEALPFTYLHVFPYSRRAGTAAAEYPDHVPKPVIALRARRLRKLSDRKRSAFAGSFVGRRLRVLPERNGSTDGPVSGYARNYVRVTVQGEPMNANREVAVRIRAVREARAEGVIDSPG
jgi:threonylcarbamoyladenosine tRNA methylthiotransferase MtaB